MGEILFRGKTKKGIWHQGFLTFQQDGFWIREVTDYGPNMNEPCGGQNISDYEIIPETIGQYTGQKDSAETKIFKGDIIEFTYWWFDGDERESQLIGVIGFENMSFTLEKITNDFFQNHTGYKKGEGSISFGELTYSDDDFKIIGNIHENPELLELEND